MEEQNNSVDEFNVLDTFESIEPEISPEVIRENEERLERATLNPDEFNFTSFLQNELGIEDGKILTGDPESPIEYDLSDLNMQQQVALLKKHYQDAQESNSLTKDEQYVLEQLRTGNIEDVYNRLAEELGQSSQNSYTPDIDVSQYSDDEIMLWKLKNDYPNMTDDELAMELDSLKDSPTYEKKTEGAKNLLQQTLEYQKQQQEQQSVLQAQQAKEQLQQSMIESATQMEDLFGFELDDAIKNQALADLLEAEEGDSPELIKFLDTPEGLVQTATLWRAMPQINEYVNGLHEEIDSLKNKLNNSDDRKTMIAQNDPKKTNYDNLDIKDFGTLETI